MQAGEGIMTSTVGAECAAPGGYVASVGVGVGLDTRNVSTGEFGGFSAFGEQGKFDGETGA